MIDGKECERGSSLIISDWCKIDSLPGAYQGYATALNINIYLCNTINLKNSVLQTVFKFT